MTRNLATDRKIEHLIPRSTLQKMRTRKRGDGVIENVGPPYYRIGARCYYDVGEVEAWLASRRVPSAKEVLRA